MDVTVLGQKLRRGAKLWPVGVSVLKSELYHALKLSQGEEGFPPGYCHFPSYGPQYFKQLTSEQLVTKVYLCKKRKYRNRHRPLAAFQMG